MPAGARPPRVPGGNEKPMWDHYALLSALFAALTAIFAKTGVKGIGPNLSAAIRATVVALITRGTAAMGGRLRGAGAVPGRAWVFPPPGGAATGLSWLSCLKAPRAGGVSRVAPVDKLGAVIAIASPSLSPGERVRLKAVPGVWTTTGGSTLMLLK